MSRAVILCDGAYPTEAYPLYLLSSAPRLVCCDGAFAKYLEHNPSGRLPDAVVGDMDSLPQELREKYASLVFPVAEQDYNDLTKAMRFVLEHFPDCDQIDILGATGEREDHTVGNLGLLMEYTRMFPQELRIQMVSDYGTAFAVSDSCELHLGEGRRVSLFSADNSLRLHSEGLEWPTDEVVFDAWWKASLNRSTQPVVRLTLSHPAPVLVMID